MEEGKEPWYVGGAVPPPQYPQWQQQPQQQFAHQPVSQQRQQVYHPYFQHGQFYAQQEQTHGWTQQKQKPHKQPAPEAMNQEDLASKARAWASAKSVEQPSNKNPQSSEEPAPIYNGAPETDQQRFFPQLHQQFLQPPPQYLEGAQLPFHGPPAMPVAPWPPAPAMHYPPSNVATVAPRELFVQEQPRKVVPVWLKDELKKAVVPRATAAPVVDTMAREPEPEQETSAHSTPAPENEDEFEDDYERRKRAAVNQEIKSVLTEVLLKVTDSLLNEIAAEVVAEEEPTTQARVLVANGEGRNGNILGLANYASDDDFNEENQGKENEENGNMQALNPKPEENKPQVQQEQQNATGPEPKSLEEKEHRHKRKRSRSRERRKSHHRHSSSRSRSSSPSRHSRLRSRSHERKKSHHRRSSSRSSSPSRHSHHHRRSKNKRRSASRSPSLLRREHSRSRSHSPGKRHRHKHGHHRR